MIETLEQYTETKNALQDAAAKIDRVVCVLDKEDVAFLVDLLGGEVDNHWKSDSFYAMSRKQNTDFIRGTSELRLELSRSLGGKMLAEVEAEHQDVEKQLSEYNSRKKVRK